MLKILCQCNDQVCIGLYPANGKFCEIEAKQDVSEECLKVAKESDASECQEHYACWHIASI